MADDLSNVCTIGISPVGEALRGLKQSPGKRDRRPAKAESLAEDFEVEDGLTEEEQAGPEEHQLDVNA